MNVEQQRLDTYKNCTDISVNLKCKLALYGLYYNQSDDTVKCFLCGSKFYLDDGEEILKKHPVESPNCRFFFPDSPNKAIDPRLLDLPEKFTDECGIGSTSQKCKGTLQTDPNNISYRINSFENWKGAVSAQQLASAGFWFTGDNDVVVCKDCNIQINDWVVGDDPWLEHIKYSHDCDIVKRFVRTYEGRLYSFKDWSGEQSIKSMVAFAGFFYTGYGDTTKTSCCGQIVKNWDKRHAPMEIHKKIEPKCEIVSFFPKIPTDKMLTFFGLNLDDKIKHNLINQSIYYEKFTNLFVCNECQYSSLNCHEFVHSNDCKHNKLYINE